jgi:hypothetical protein
MPLSKSSKTPQSGLSEVITPLSYPRILDLKDIPEIAGKFVYVIRGYPEDGLAVTIKRDPAKDDVWVIVSDWDGNNIPLNDAKHPLQGMAMGFVRSDSPKFIEVMRLLKIPQAIFYLSANKDGEFTLVDVRTSLNKFCGPGMVKELFSKVVNTQEILSTTYLTPEVMSGIQNNVGSYQGDLILKTSAFKTIQRGKEMLPLYARVKR